jgi:hypothetical protein
MKTLLMLLLVAVGGQLALSHDLHEDKELLDGEQPLAARSLLASAEDSASKDMAVEEEMEEDYEEEEEEGKEEEVEEEKQFFGRRFRCHRCLRRCRRICLPFFGDF